MKLNRNPKYLKLVARPSDDDYRSMFEDIKEHGLREPLKVKPNGDILDGYTREDICKKLGKEPKFKIIKKKSEADYVAYIISLNVKRRHLNPYQKAESAIPILEEERIAAKKRMNKGTLSSQEVRGTATKKAAKAVGISHSTLERALYVKEHADKKMQKKLESGELAIKTAYGLLTRTTRNLPKTPPPKGEFDVFLCDVPIAFDDKGGRGAAENHYTTMDPEALAEMKLHSAENAIMFFWIPSSIQYSEVTIADGWSQEDTPVYKYILDAWGFKVKGEFVWNKGKIGRGSYNRNQHENLLVAIKGKMPTPAKLYSSIIEASRGKHSEKPEIVYEMIEKMYPKRKYVELFARKKRKGWTSHGNELKKPEKIWVCKVCGDNEEIPENKKQEHLAWKHPNYPDNAEKTFFTQISK